MSFKKPFSSKQKTEETTQPLYKKCSPECNLFRCSQRALAVRFEKGKKIVWCNFVPGGDYCQGPNCNYAICAQHKLRAENTCGLYAQKNKQSENESLNMHEEETWKKPVQLKSKVLKRLKNLSDLE
ncbi:MAG: hypothetical protein OdinLCB4_001370 [Candidatus Odinarchaeum yellowstonii]|uniref:Uncharacterized protein n=1 Tax=Odinarchaeota yellowstonii (strain LCB_4) TaxID=1841599 RepID=A0AAF0D2V2_ODILC|nr:MAG: hypothetical protein OdinLCB4_001370 [Candidatus Odinarchaeum yellowstonii]